MTEAQSVYVSITGLQLKQWRYGLRFAWHAFRSMLQARRAQGNLQAETKAINGVRHTLTVWESEAHMRRFLYRRALDRRLSRHRHGQDVRVRNGSCSRLGRGARALARTRQGVCRAHVAH